MHDGLYVDSHLRRFVQITTRQDKTQHCFVFHQRAITTVYMWHTGWHPHVCTYDEVNQARTAESCTDQVLHRHSTCIEECDDNYASCSCIIRGCITDQAPITDQQV